MAGKWPKVKAWRGPLPPDRTGYEFFTDVEPDAGSPPGQAYWRQGRPGVLVIEWDEIVAIGVTVTKRRDRS
jgi:hypothetical protein